MKKMREEFAETMLEIGIKDKSLVVLVGDISHGILKPYATACPDRYYNIGICEPSIVNMAAGLSKVGLIPVVHTIAPFITERAYEQIKLDFGYQKLGVNIVSVGASFDYAQLGCSHHCYTDVSLMCHFKNSCVFVPGTAKEFRQMFIENYSNGKINYYRLSEFNHGEDRLPSLETGKGIMVTTGTDLTICVIGPLLKNVVAAAKILRESKISAEILYFPTVKPFDFHMATKSIQKTKRLLTVEDLSAHDGLSNLCLKASVGIEGLKWNQIAVEDFIHGYGTYDELCLISGLDTRAIVKTAVSLIR